MTHLALKETADISRNYSEEFLQTEIIYLRIFHTDMSANIRTTKALKQLQKLSALRQDN